MKTNALAIANYFVELANKCGEPLRLLGLVKRVYITHGFTLAYYDRSAINPRFDIVEAWRLGPVIPSVYHSFKHNGRDPITEPSVIVIDVEGELEVITPTFVDSDIRNIADMVWERYKGMNDSEMVKLLHHNGTPWELCYEEGMNNVIPDLYTKTFYKKLL